MQNNALTAEFTETEKRLLTLLSDGQPHTKRELEKCLNESYMPCKQSIPFHVFNIRRKLKVGTELIYKRIIQSYILVRIVSNEAYTGR